MILTCCILAISCSSGVSDDVIDATESTIPPTTTAPAVATTIEPTAAPTSEAPPASILTPAETGLPGRAIEVGPATNPGVELEGGQVARVFVPLPDGSYLAATDDDGVIESGDGLTWAPSERIDLAALGPGAEVVSLWPFGDGWLARTQEADRVDSFWVSPDGRAWD